MNTSFNFTDDEFLNLIDEVEAQGGSHINGAHCTSTKFALKQPNAKGELRFKDFFTTGCGRESLFEVNPLAMAGDGDPFQRDLPVTVCALDDGMRQWPRFAAALETER